MPANDNPPQATLPKKSWGGNMGLPLHGDFKPAPPSMDADDVYYLTQKGAFSLPSTGFRQHLLQSYLDFVHPLRPVLEIDDILRMQRCTDGRPISYLLFQAVMLGGCLFVHHKHLAAAGYATRNAAQQAFYDKSRLLYEHDYEEDEFVMAQALVLMSLSYDASKRSHRGSWYWSGNAVSLIKSIDVSLFQSKTDISPVKSARWRRLWWTVFAQDRAIALGLGLPIRILAGDYKVPMLELGDFNLDQGRPAVDADPDAAGLSWDKDRMRQLSKIFLEKVKLSLCIDDFLSILRTGNEEAGMLARRLQSTTEKLHSWLSCLPPDARLDLGQDTTTMDAILTVHQANLYLTYLGTVACVQKANIDTFDPKSHPYVMHAEDIRSTAQAEIQRIASEAVKTVEYLKDLDLVRYLPQSVVVAFVQANFVHLRHLTAVDNVNGIFQSMRVVEVMRDCYFDVQHGVNLVAALFERETRQDSSPAASDPGPEEPAAASEGDSIQALPLQSLAHLLTLTAFSATSLAEIHMLELDNPTVYSSLPNGPMMLEDFDALLRDPAWIGTGGEPIFNGLGPQTQGDPYQANIFVG